MSSGAQNWVVPLTVDDRFAKVQLGETIRAEPKSHIIALPVAEMTTLSYRQ